MLAFAGFTTSAAAIVNTSNGSALATAIGADRFHSAGYTGSRSVVINVDGGYAWAAHQTLGHVSEYFDGRQAYLVNGLAAEVGALGSVDQHATWIAQAIAGRGSTETARGIAYGAALWSGAIATSFVQGSTNWTWSRGHAFAVPYAASMLVGRNGRTADVVNSSWGWNDTAGGNGLAVALDGITRASGATTVFAAGNNGTNTAGFWGSPGGYNSIIVGSLAPTGTAYNTVSTFSGRGPVSYSDPLGNTVANARARVDIVAPGQAFTLARYGGTTGSNASGTDPTGGNTTLFSSGIQGTSVASGVVAGAATLLNDLAYDRYAGNARARDGQVIKAVLLNSARKITGWDNGQAADGQGVVRTTRALDFTSGAGALDLNAAFDQFTAGTNDVAGNGGGTVSRTGWDYGVIAQGSNVTYSLSGTLSAGSRLNATLNWFVGRTYDRTDPDGGLVAYDDYFTNLALQVWRLDVPGGAALVAESNAAYINTEHLSFTLASSGTYQLRVNWVGERYDLVGNASQTFGLAWNVAEVPEPGVWMLWLLGLGLVVRRARAVTAAASGSPQACAARDS